MKKKKIGVTGADGFLGKRLCSFLEKKGYDVVRYGSDNLDIRNEFKISNDIEAIYHLAALNKPYFSKTNPMETFRTNVLGTLNLLEAVKSSNVKKIIFTSSILVYKNLKKTKETDSVAYNGIYPYGLEKLIAEEYIKIYSGLSGFEYIIFRISGIYGPGMRKNPVFDIIQGFLNGKVKLFVNRNSVYNFVYIDDVVSALEKSLNWKNEILNISSDENAKIIDIYNFISKNFAKKDVKIEDEKTIIKIFGNNKKIKKRGWKINYPLKKGLAKTYNYLLAEKNETK